MMVIISILVVTVVTWVMLATQKVSLNATVLPQTGVRLASEGMASVMTGPEYLDAGIPSLTESQRRALDQWLDRYKKTVVDVLQGGFLTRAVRENGGSGRASFLLCL